MWTKFWDMNSGGGQKEKWDKIYIEAPRKEAEIIFYNRFGHNPNRITCTCCGEDYSIDSGSLESLTEFHRQINYNESNLMPLAEYIKQEDVLVITKKDIKPEEREGELPEQGYVWV